MQEFLTHSHAEEIRCMQKEEDYLKHADTITKTRKKTNVCGSKTQKNKTSDECHK